MNNQFRAVYKCRLCGEIIQNSILVSEKEASNALFAFENGETIYKSKTTQDEIHLFAVHYCDCGTMAGLADCQGFELVK